MLNSPLKKSGAKMAPPWSRFGKTVPKWGPSCGHENGSTLEPFRLIFFLSVHERMAAFVSIFISVIEDSSGGYWLIVAAAAVSLLPLTCFCCWCILCLVGMRRRRMKKGMKDPWGAPYPWGKPEKLQQIHYATAPPMVTVQVCSSECGEELKMQFF